MKNKKYNILVFKDDKGEHSQFQVSKYGLTALAGAAVTGLAALAALGYFALSKPGHTRKVADLEEKIQHLELANEEYHRNSVRMEETLNRFEEKATKLAGFVGVEAPEEAGIGGPDLDAELNPYLRYDLGMLNKKSELLEAHFEDLNKAFQQRSEMLDATPSVLPARGWISSSFKMRTDPFTKKRTWHNGIDISAQTGTPIYAPARGVVTAKGYSGGMGNMLTIDHGNGIRTRYGHLHNFNVSKGQRVERGDLIGYVGNTGRSTAPHLHYEVHKDGKAQNPMKYIIRDTQTF
ncbi:MAG: M23 family metallopeptidase [Acidobacteriota bacterium]|nr:M23 family metallopeptidase [Acidobacteriota bacterium]